MSANGSKLNGDDDTRSYKNVFDDSELIEKHELVGQATEFGTTNSDIFTIVEDDQLANQPQPLAPVDSNNVAIDSDYDRPHNKSDESTTMIDGAVQATTKQLCSFDSIQWAANIVGLVNENPAHTRTQVS